MISHAVGNGEQVGRRAHDDVGFEVLYQLHLSIGLAARHGDHCRTEGFDSGMSAQTSGEQAVTVRVVHAHAGAHSARAKRPRDQTGPDRKILPGVADDGRTPGGAR